MFILFFLWNVALYGAGTWILRRRWEAFKTWIWRKMEHVKWTDKIRNEAVLEESGRRRNNAEFINEEKKKMVDHWLPRNYLMKDTLEGMMNKKISANRQH